MNEQKSASAMQVEEKRKRLNVMLDLAISVTKNELQKLNPDLPHEQLLMMLKQKDIPIKPFLNEFIMQPDCSVTMNTAISYFDSYAHSLNPIFTETKVGHFRLNDVSLHNMIMTAKQVKKPWT